MTTRITDAEWTPCPPGMLRSIPTDGPENGRRSFLTGITAGTLVGVLGMGTVAWQRRSQSPSGLTCAECIELFPAFSRVELQQRVSYRVEVHLAECPNCRRQYEQQYG